MKLHKDDKAFGTLKVYTKRKLPYLIKINKYISWHSTPVIFKTQYETTCTFIIYSINTIYTHHRHSLTSYVEQQEYEGFHSSIEHSSSRPLGTRQNLLSLAHCVGTRSVITRLSALSGNMLQYGCYSSIYIESNLVHKHLHVNIHIFCFRQRDRWFKKFWFYFNNTA